MGLLTILKKLKQKEKEMGILMSFFEKLNNILLSNKILIKTVFCRDLDNAGKTTIVERLIGEPINTISPTLVFNIKTLVTMDSN